ncbi:MAG: putative quinol monooxygenase [Actinomycetota bacterium]
MIIVAGHIRLDPANREAAIAAASEMMAETAKEAGCVTYVFSASFDEPGLFHLFEEWESQDHLDAHFAAPHMATFQSAMAGFGVSERSINKYSAADKAPL